MWSVLKTISCRLCMGDYMNMGLQIVQTVLYIGLALMIFKIVIMPSLVDIVKQYKELNKEEETCQDQDL